MNLRKLEEKYPITLIALIVSLIYIFYVEVVQKENIELSFSIVNNSNVFDINEPIEDLEIKYENRNLVELNESLKLLTLKIENTGNKHLVEDMYYSKVPFGAELLNGKIIQKPELIESSFEYSGENINYNDSLNFIYLPKLPLDKGDFYSIKVLYLAKDKVGEIIPKGKISGMKSISVSDSSNKPVSGVLGLPRFMQILLAIPIFVMFLLILYSLFSGILRYFKTRQKRSLLKKFKKKNKAVELPKEIEYLFMEFDKPNFQKLEEILTDSDKFKEIIVSDKNIMKELQKQREYDPVLYSLYDDEYCKGYIRYPLRKLIKNASSIFNFPQNKFSGDPKDELKPEFVENIKIFLEFLKHN